MFLDNVGIFIYGFRKILGLGVEVEDFRVLIVFKWFMIVSIFKLHLAGDKINLNDYVQ